MSDIRVEERSGVHIVTIDRPRKANALRRETVSELTLALGRIEATASSGGDVFGVILTGAGGRFTAGADLAGLSGTIDDRGFDDLLESLTRKIVGAGFPVVAAVEGACFGAGVDLAWSCDGVVTSPTTRFGLPATGLGLLYNPISLERLHARLGSSMVRRLVVLGATVMGSEMPAAILVPEGKALESAMDLIIGAKRVPAATAAAKDLLASLDATGFDAAEWDGVRTALLSSPERAQAAQARLDSLKKNG